MSTPAENAATVREALRKHHAVGYTVVWGARCEVCDRHEPFAALDALEAQAEDAAYFRNRLGDFSATEQASFARAEAAEAELGEYREANRHGLASLMRERNAAKAERDRLAARVEKLEAALRLHGEHKAGCELAETGSGGCTCGFDAALATDKEPT